MPAGRTPILRRVKLNKKIQKAPEQASGYMPEELWVGTPAEMGVGRRVSFSVVKTE